MATRKSLSDALRDAIARDGRSGYQLAIDADVARAIVSRFIRGDRGIDLKTADKLCEALGLELRPVKRTRKGG